MKSRNKIAKKLLIYILLFSSIVTICTTAIQLQTEYNRDIENIEGQFSKIEDIFKPALAQALWFFNDKSIKVLLEGISQLNDIEYIELIDEKNRLTMVGEKQSKHLLTKHIPLIYNRKNKEIEVGTLTVVASKTKTYKRLFERLIIVLLSQGVKTFLVSIFIFFLVHFLVTKHLGTIDTYLKKIYLGNPTSLLELQRRSPLQGDELDHMVASINEMTEQLHRTYEKIEQTVQERTADLKNTNEQLKLEIKERKQAEEEMKKYQEIMRKMNDGFVIINPQGTLLEINDYFTRMTGWTKEDLIGTKPPYKFWRKKDVPSIMERLSVLQDKGQTVNTFEQILQKKDGGEIPGLINSTILYDSNSKPKYFFGIFQDITDIKQAEESLRKESHDLSERIKELNCLYGISDLVGTTGKSLDEILQGTVALLPHSWQYPQVTCSRIILKGKEYKTENFKETKWRQSRELFVRRQPIGALEVYYLEEKPGIKDPFVKETRDLIYAVAEQLGRIIEHKLDEEALKKSHDELESRVDQRTLELRTTNEQLHREIEERKRIEKSLKESEERYAEAEKRTHFGHWSRNIVEDKAVWSSEACRIFGINPSQFIPSYENFLNFVHPEDRELVKNAMLEDKPFDIEYRITRADGEERVIHALGEAHFDKRGRPEWLGGTLHDITEQKQAEAQIKASLREKEVLLKEVHHRVKNNLQIISSLLDMSRRRAGNQEAIDLLSETDAKIHTMALIHTQLYQSDRFDQIDMQRHIRDLIIYISQLYGTKKNITPVINTSDVILSVTQAIPFALAMNELIANVFKHAFEGGKGGILEVSMEQSSDGAIFVKVKDDGIGIPEEVDIDNTDTLGLKLVRNLVLKQLKGKLRIERNNGTEVFIEFKVS